MQYQSESITDLAKALSKAQSEITGAVKGSDNPFFKSAYANLESVWEAVRGPITRNELSITQIIGVMDNGAPTLITQLMHGSGQWIRGYHVLIPTKYDPQSMGSAITYARRYGLAAILSVPQIDDDGNAASEQAWDAGGAMAVPPVTTEAGSYKIKAGKRKGTAIKDIDTHELAAIVDWWKQKQQEGGKAPEGALLSDLIAIKEWLSHA